MSSRICPHNNAQDGVCGCPEFWTKKLHHQPVPPSTPTATKPLITPSIREISEMRSPSPTPAGPVKQTCFFWYHGSCRSRHCQFEHESHFTWPIEAPPGYKHYEPCKLSQCPLREDLVAMEKSWRSEKNATQLGGQVDGQAFSRFSTVESDASDGSESSIKTTDSNAVANERGDIVESRNSVVLSEPLRGPSSAVIESRDDNDNAIPDSGGLATSRLSARDSPLPFSNTDYVDLSGIASMPPSSDKGNSHEPLLSLSHAGTLRKSRPSSTLLEELAEDSRQRKLQSKLMMDELYRSNALDLRALAELKPPLMDFGPDIDDDLPQDFPIDLRSMAEDQFCPLRLPSGLIPLVCFEWYHKGYCQPRIYFGRPGKCLYHHTLDTIHQKVSPPPMVTDHDPGCALPLCPLWLQGREAVRSDHVSPRIKSESEEYCDLSAAPLYDRYSHPHQGIPISPYQRSREHSLADNGSRTGDINGFSSTGGYLYKRETTDASEYDMRTDTSLTPEEERDLVKCESLVSDDSPSSSPRVNLKQALFAAGVKRAGRRTIRRLPKLTGAARDCFKEQQRRIEKWQADNGIKPESLDTRRAENKRMKKAMKKQREREERLAQETMPASNPPRTPECECCPLPVVSVLPTVTGTGPSSARVQPDATVRPSERGHTTEAEFHRETPVPISRSPEPMAVDDVQDEGDKKQCNADVAMGAVETLERSHDTRAQSPHTKIQSVADFQEQDEHENGVIQNEISMIADGAPRQSGVLVAYDLPSGQERLPWDTDLVRQLFGEIA